MAKKPVVISLAIVLFFLGWLVSCTPENSTLPIRPHLNPETLSQGYSDVELMRYIAGVLNSVIAEDPEQLARLAGKVRFANIRPEAAESVRQLLSSAQSLSRNMVTSKAYLEAITLLAKQNRLEKDGEMVLDLAGKLLFALTDLDELEKSAKAMFRMVNADKSPKGSGIQSTYEQATQQLVKIAQPIEAISQFSRDGDVEALRKKLQIQIYSTQYSDFRPTDIDLEVLPVRAYVGDTISFSGKLTSRDVALPGKEVVLELDDKKFAKANTDSDGYYSGELRLPYTYNESVTIRSRYISLGEDANVYLTAINPSTKIGAPYRHDETITIRTGGSSIRKDADIYLAAISPPVKVKTIFYTSQLRLGATLKGHPGLSTAIEGGFSYDDPPLAGTRKVDVLVDDSPVDSAVVDEDFSIELALDSKMNVGRHQVTVVALGQGRYGPTTAPVALTVVKATPVVDLKTTWVAFIPMGLEIHGKAESEIAPLNTAQIRLKLGQRVIETNTGVDGTFQYNVGLSFLSKLIGRQGLEVEVIPLEPWNAPVSAHRNVWVFNPIGLVIILAVVAIVYYSVKLRMKTRRVEPATASHPPILSPEGISGTSGVLASQSAGSGTIGLHSGEDSILQIYKAMVRFIAGMLGIKIKPHLTLRELAKELSPQLGAVSSYMWQMTLIVERVLYSKHSLVEKERQDVENLASQIRKGIKHASSQ